MLSLGIREQDKRVQCLHHKPPISSALQSQKPWILGCICEGIDAPSFEEIVKSYEKFIPEQIALLMKSLRSHILMADGSERITIFAKDNAFHVAIPGIPGRTIGTQLEEGTTTPAY